MDSMQTKNNPKVDNLEALIRRGLQVASPKLLSELSSLDEELKIREQENKCEKFTPNGKSEQFIKLVGADRCFVNLFFGGNGTTKTGTGVNIVANICFGPQNEWFNGLPLFEKFPYLKRGRIISDPTTIKEKIIPELKKWFPSNRYEVKYETEKAGKFWESKWTTSTGFEFDIMSNEQDAKEFESTDLGWCWFDEPSREEIFSATVARGRMGMVIFWTVTPLLYSAWMKDRLYDKRDGKEIDFIEAEMEDNCEEHGVRGILQHKNIERMIAQMTPDEREAREKGKFGHLVGRVHKLFDRRIHVIQPFKITPEEFTVYRALDTHPREDDHVLWMAINSKGVKFFIAELVMKGTDAQLAAAIKAIEGGWRGAGVGGKISGPIDPSAYNMDLRTGEKSFGDKLHDLGLQFEPGSKDLSGGIRAMDEALWFETKLDKMVREPMIYFFSTVPIAIKQVETYVWDEYAGRSRDDHQKKPKPKDKDDHNVENAHRLLIADYKYVHFRPGSSAIRNRPYVPASPLEGGDVRPGGEAQRMVRESGSVIPRRAYAPGSELEGK